MKANELMVGDYLMYNGLTYRVIQVDGIVRDGWMIENGEEDCGEPIPLTPEILEKNGFKWTTHKSYMVFCIGTVRIIWGFYKDCLSISDHSDDYVCQILSLKCNFVHELQHTLRQCKIEKEIIL